MARFSDQLLEEIRTRLNLVDVISEYVQLKKSGSGYQGLCPFHGEKTPSFHVHPEKQIFHCFGCHKGGNAFTFLMGIEGWSFPETVKKLAEKTGVDIPKDPAFEPRKPSPAVQAEQDRLYAANEWAAKYYQFNLKESKDPTARNYLKARGLSEKTIEKFRIGLSPVGWNGLIQLMLKRGYTFDELTRAGLAIAKEDSPNGGYDRFRNRIMFPITNKDGNVVGFGARILEDDPKQPKYLNSSESALFSKRNILYGLHENQRGIRLRNEAVVVEGYMDVVGLYEAGVQNAVATMGTAFTEEHCVILKGLTRKVVTVFDPDKAGTEASRRSIHVFLEAGMFAKDLTLPDGKDPDEHVLAHGAESFYELCDKAPHQVTKLLKEIAGEGALSEEQRSQWLERLTPILVASRRLPNRALLFDNISLVMQVSVESLQAIAEGARTRQPTGAPQGQGNSSSQQQGGFQSGPPMDQPPWEQQWEQPPFQQQPYQQKFTKKFNKNPGQKGQWQKNFRKGFQPEPSIPLMQETPDEAGRNRGNLSQRVGESKMEFDFFMAALGCQDGLRAIPADLWRKTFSDRSLVNHLDALVKTETTEDFTARLGEILSRSTDPELLNKASSLILRRIPFRAQTHGARGTGRTHLRAKKI